MFPAHGVVGAILVVLEQLNFYFKIEPFAYWSFPIIWAGYILFVDALVYKIKGHSPLMDHRREFLLLFVLSVPFWYIFEGYNYFMQNWYYTPNIMLIGKIVSFSTVMPAIYITYRLVRATNIFSSVTSGWRPRLSKSALYGMIVLGLFSAVAPILWPRYAFFTVWLAFFLILDPINYLGDRPSLLGNVKEGKLEIPLSLALAGPITGFFWEFWNFWGVVKWFYTIPFVDALPHLFEMPLPGYIGYIPFSFEVYAVYWFTRGDKKRICP